MCQKGIWDCSVLNTPYSRFWNKMSPDFWSGLRFKIGVCDLWAIVKGKQYSIFSHLWQIFILFYSSKYYLWRIRFLHIGCTMEGHIFVLEEKFLCLMTNFGLIIFPLFFWSFFPGFQCSLHPALSRPHPYRPWALPVSLFCMEMNFSLCSNCSLALVSWARGDFCLQSHLRSSAHPRQRHQRKL